jgi:hypothetical protein
MIFALISLSNGVGGPSSNGKLGAKRLFKRLKGLKKIKISTMVRMVFCSTGFNFCTLAVFSESKKNIPDLGVSQATQTSQRSLCRCLNNRTIFDFNQIQNPS